MSMHPTDGVKKPIKVDQPPETKNAVEGNTISHTIGYIAAIVLPLSAYVLKTMFFPSDAAKEQARKAAHYDAIKACVVYTVADRSLFIKNGNGLTKVQGTSGQVDTTGAILNLNLLNPQVLKDLYTPQPTKIVKDGGTPFDRWGITLSK